MYNYLYIFTLDKLTYFCYTVVTKKGKKGVQKMKKMDKIVRSEINAMVEHVRGRAKREKNPQRMCEVIESDFTYASGIISALMRADVISVTEWKYDRMVLKYHYCRLLAIYGGRPYMYKDDRDFYYTFVR